MLHEYLMPASVDAIVIAMCGDVGRRRRTLKAKTLSRRTEMEFRYLNYKILEATVEIVGEDEAGIFIKEIGEKIGYARSELIHYSEATYKNLKKAVKMNIAKKLHLID